MHECLHENMVQLCFGSSRCTSLASFLLESLTKHPVAAVERVLCISPPNQLFVGDITNLSEALKLVLDAFDGPSVAWLLLGIALCLDEISLETKTRPMANYHAQRDCCLEIARKYLLDKVRRGRPSWLVSLRDQIEAELSNRQATVAIEWWKEVCLVVLDKQPSSLALREVVPSIPSMISAIEGVDAASLTPSLKRATLTLLMEAPSTKLDSMDMEQVGEHPVSAADRTEVASRRLEQVLLRGTTAETDSSSTTGPPAILRTRIVEPGMQAIDERNDDFVADDDDDDDVKPMVDTEEPLFSPNDDDDDYDDDCILLLELH
jgi:hypothetical protein